MSTSYTKHTDKTVQFQALYYTKHNQIQHLCLSMILGHRCICLLLQLAIHPTLMRQALLTSCLGSTTSTRGSLIATSLMHDISKPYTFSHPDTQAQTQTSQFTENNTCGLQSVVSSPVPWVVLRFPFLTIVIGLISSPLQHVRNKNPAPRPA